MYRLTFLNIILLLGMGWAEEQPQEKIRQVRLELEQLKRENVKLDREISRTDSLKAEEAARSSKLEQNYQQDLERRGTEIAEIKEKLQEVTRDIQKEQKVQAGLTNNIDEQVALEKALRINMMKQCEGLEQEILLSLPWDLEARAERVRVLKRDMESGTASLEEGFNRLSALYTAEISAGDEITLLEKPVTRNDGETVNARVLKIGNQWLVYADEEDKKFGVLRKTGTADGPQYTWREDLSFTERQAVREALEVKMAKKPPKLVTLPLTLSLDPQDDEKGEQ